MTGFDYKRAQSTARRLLTYFGTSEDRQGGFVRRPGVPDIPVVFVETNYSLHDRATGVIGVADRRILMEATDFEPRANEDLLIIEGVAHKIIPPVSKLAPAGTVIYYELQVRR